MMVWQLDFSCVRVCTYCRSFCSLFARAFEQAVAADLNMKSMVEKLLTDSEYSEKRSNKLDMDDFLKLLELFNSAGLHFC